MSSSATVEAMVEGRKNVEEGGIVYREWTRKQIDDELRDNGHNVDTGGFGYDVQRLIGFDMEISSKIARGKFVVTEKMSLPNGQLITGVASYVAESIGSASGAFASESKRIAGVELNLNNLHPAYVGQEVTVIAKLLKQSNRVQTWEIKLETEHSKEQSSRTESHGDEHSRETVLIAIGRLTLLEQSLHAGPMSTLQKQLLDLKNPPSKL